MEALAIIGLTSNICQFLENGYKLIGIARELYSSPNGSVTTIEQTAFIAKEMLELSNRLSNNAHSDNESEDAKALTTIAQRCGQVATRLQELSTHIQGRQKSQKYKWAAAVKGAFRYMRIKGEKDDLKMHLDECRQQLNLQLLSMSQWVMLAIPSDARRKTLTSPQIAYSSDLFARLETLVGQSGSTENEIKTLQNSLESMRKTSSVDTANITMFLNVLNRTIAASARQKSLLDMIPVPEMNKRFERVEGVYEKTFEWLLRSVEQVSSQAVSPEQEAASQKADRNMKQIKHEEFIQWLEATECGEIPTVPRMKIRSPDSHGRLLRNIYHIAGKPGSGKSTLMKYIYEHEDTTKHLNVWRGNKSLLVAKAFLWRWGGEEEKNFAGLANCLLHQILRTAPVLHQYTGLPTEAEAENNKSHTLTSLVKALQRLLESNQAFKDHKIMIFIDGLDEFSGKPMDLTRKILGWASAGGENVKILVSSREWNEFELGFEGYPRLRIHEYTKADLTIFTNGRLAEASLFANWISPEEIITLCERIVCRAEGVFIWVRLVLANVEGGILNGDTVQDLQRKLDEFPEELNELYQHLFDSIPKPDRLKAYSSMLLARHFYWRDLLAFSILDRLFRDHDFALKLAVEPMTQEKIDKSAMLAKRQIYGRCKGFLSVRLDPDKGEEVQFMHSTALEFLGILRITDEVRRIVSADVIVDNMCQVSLGLMKCYPQNAKLYEIDTQVQRFHPYYHEIAYLNFNSLKFYSGGFEWFDQWFGGGAKSFPQPCPERLIRTLDSMGTVLKARYAGVCEGLPVIDKRVSGLHSEEDIHKASVDVAIPIIAARSLLFECFDKSHRPSTSLHGHNWSLPTDQELAFSVTNNWVSEDDDVLCSERSYHMHRVILQLGVSPLTNLFMEQDQSISAHLWGRTLRELLFNPSKSDQNHHDLRPGWEYGIIELYIKHGADESFGIRFGPCYESREEENLLVVVRGTDGQGQRTKLDSNAVQWLLRHDADIVQHARKYDNWLSLRQLLSICFPADCHRLFEMLDKTKAGVSNTDNYDLQDRPEFALTYGRPLKTGFSMYKKSFCVDHSNACYEAYEKRKDADRRSETSGV